MLESMLDQPVNTIAYPYGGAGDFNQDTLNIVREAGFKAACTTIGGFVTKNRDAVALPRCWVGDWELSTFKQQLETFFIK
jgi:hypothetical protein